ncbi:RNA polymerase sigma factor [Streptomyces sp. NPDC055099]
MKTPDTQAASSGGKKPTRSDASRADVPRQPRSEPVLGDYGVDDLPPASRKQWKQAVGMRTTCLALAYRLVPWDETEDVWQDTKLSVWRRLCQGPVDHISAYVRTVCRNAAIDRLKAKKRRAEIFFGDEVEQLQDREPGPVFNETLDTRIKEILGVIRPVMTEHEARIYVLRAGLGWQIKVVAEALEISEDAVKSAYQSGKRKVAGTGLSRRRLFRALNPD